MIVFLDFEASSLSKTSYPIEIGWVFEDGQTASFMIKPAPDWTDWSDEAEQIHKISRAMLAAEGVEVNVVATAMIEALQGHTLYASAPSWDGKWLSVLLRSAGYPRHALRLVDSERAFQEAAREILGLNAPEDQIEELVTQCMQNKELSQPVHRALADAKAEHACWLQVRSEALALRESNRSRDD